MSTILVSLSIWSKLKRWNISISRYSKSWSHIKNIVILKRCLLTLWTISLYDYDVWWKSGFYTSWSTQQFASYRFYYTYSVAEWHSLPASTEFQPYYDQKLNYSLTELETSAPFYVGKITFHLLFSSVFFFKDTEWILRFYLLIICYSNTSRWKILYLILL